MVASPGYARICRFDEVKVGQPFSSSKEDADYIKLDAISGQRADGRSDDIGLFEANELVYVGGARSGVIY